MKTPTPLGHLIDKVSELYPDSPPLGLKEAAKLICLVDEDRKQQAAPPEIVRVMRVYVFEGERKAIEEQLARSLGDGTRHLANTGAKGIKIHVATIGAIPQTLLMQSGYPGWAGKGRELALTDLPKAEPLGAHFVYVCRQDWAGHLAEEYARAISVGATMVVIPSTKPDHACNMYPIETFAKDFNLIPKVVAPQVVPAPAVSESPAPIGGHMAGCVWSNDHRKYLCVEGCEIKRINDSIPPPVVANSADAESVSLDIAAGINKE